VSLW